MPAGCTDFTPARMRCGLDYVDSAVPMLVKMHEKRMKGFRAMGYEQ